MVHEGTRAAVEDVALAGCRGRDAAASGLERVDGHLGRTAAADQEAHRCAGHAPERLQLLAEDDVLPAAGAIQQHQVTLSGLTLLDHGAQRRDADAAGDEQGLAAPHPFAGEGAIWPLGEDPGARSQGGQSSTVVAQVLDGDAQGRAVGGRRDGERMVAPPATTGQETELEVLAGADGQLAMRAPVRWMDTTPAASWTIRSTRSRWRTEKRWAGTPGRSAAARRRPRTGPPSTPPPPGRR